MMTLQDLLAQKGLTENVNYTIAPDEDGVITITPLLSTKWEFSPQLDDQGQLNGNQDFKQVEYMPEIAPVMDLMAEIRVQEGLKSQELGAKIIAAVYAINESNNISAQEFGALLADANIARIERLLWSGSLKTAKMLISALDDTYFTSQEKQSILDMLADY